jgi:hypothetical protein
MCDFPLSKLIKSYSLVIKNPDFEIKIPIDPQNPITYWKDINERIREETQYIGIKELFDG